MNPVIKGPTEMPTDMPIGRPPPLGPTTDLTGKMCQEPLFFIEGIQTVCIIFSSSPPHEIYSLICAYALSTENKAHWFCGIGINDANAKCGVHCPTAAECPMGNSECSCIKVAMHHDLSYFGHIFTITF